MTDGMVFCRACGATIHSSAPHCPQCGAPQAAASGRGDGIPRTFANSIAICFRKYASFEGRAPRAEYWYFHLFYFVTQLVIGFLVALANGPGAITGLAVLAFILPSIGVTVRRLHDLGRSGWWYWLLLLPIIGGIVLFVWMCTRGTRAGNRYGPENGLA
jgi:uncharacterized membrane protein YhaH (DUF805 family)